ncbi:hypothetical protein [Rugamonas sp.]|uniref:hypothetical protein n=1 Tax=Rugamonas sp. TaxID=1926287 RepID=UPI0025E93377|nr:hypothetical protein [Rugamonas sp.]
MKTMKWLLQRELWENKGMLFWTPVVVAALMAAVSLAAVLAGGTMNYGDGRDVHIGAVVITDTPLRMMGEVIANSYIVTAMPILLILGLLVFFYCLGALHDERSDRSLLFWKSLPVSDRMTVLSKAATALVVAPLIVFVVGIALSLLMLAIGCFALLSHGTNAFGAILSQPGFYLAPLELIALLPVYLLWALPSVGWLLLVSSWARSKVFLWAVGVPLAIGLALLWAQRGLGMNIDGSWFLGTITSRALLGVAPGAWFMFEQISPAALTSGADHHPNVGTILNASWLTLGSIGVWVGAAAGVAMIAGATWMRRWREEN